MGLGKTARFWSALPRLRPVRICVNLRQSADQSGSRLSPNPDHRRVGMVGVWDHTLAVAIDQQVRGFQRGLADQNFIPENQKILTDFASEDFQGRRFTKNNTVGPSVGISGQRAVLFHQTELVHEWTWHHRSHRAGIHHRQHICPAYLFRPKLSPARQRLIERVAQPDLDQLDAL